MEYLYNEFIPVWLAVGKHHNYEIGLGQIEELYARIPYNILQQLRVNRTVPLYEGSNKTGRPMANWAFDALIELLQHKYKAMQFPNSIEGWQSHSGNMPLVSRCQNFSDLEYSRSFDVEAFDSKFIEGVLDPCAVQETGQNAKRQKTAIPRRAKEKQMIAEILSRSGACREQPQRKMTKNLFWDKLPNLTTLLTTDANVESQTPGERRTDEELAVSNMTDEFLDDFGAPINTEAETAANAVLEPAVLAALTGIAPAKDDLEQDTEQEEEEEPIESDEVEIEITVGERRFGKVSKIRVNPFCLKDVGAFGRKKMVDSNVSALRHRRKQPSRRERMFLQTSLMNTLNGTMGSRTMDLVMRLDTGGLQEQPCFRKRFNSPNY
jgi:hypothetical protein